MLEKVGKPVVFAHLVQLSHCTSVCIIYPAAAFSAIEKFQVQIHTGHNIRKYLFISKTCETWEKYVEKEYHNTFKIRQIICTQETNFVILPLLIK